ncbi:hypothetical protein [Pseudomonas sp. SDI]|uniref:hypothetical protein n=1 Tax=Pseudomonas sp. SDI TaxID=2170734 RepID=UPI00140319FB|nr:hypothetical protein [Pseudomonas sp. SDI]
MDMLQATQRLRAQLQQVPGVQVGFRTFPDLNHGQMLDASPRHTLDKLYAAPSPAR